MVKKAFCAGIRQASADEPAAAEFYRRLIKNAPNAAVRREIRRIRADEVMHQRLFSAIKRRFGC